jgi:hypothetical protein
MRCVFCGGLIIEERCIMCSRTPDIEHENYVKREQKKEHHNWHGRYQGDPGRHSKRSLKNEHKEEIEI